MTDDRTVPGIESEKSPILRREKAQIKVLTNLQNPYVLHSTSLYAREEPYQSPIYSLHPTSQSLLPSKQGNVLRE